MRKLMLAATLAALAFGPATPTSSDQAKATSCPTPECCPCDPADCPMDAGSCPVSGGESGNGSTAG